MASTHTLMRIISNAALVACSTILIASIRAQVWSQKSVPGPGTRALHGMVFDSARSRTICFGGSNSNGGANPFGDTWEWDGSTWSQVNTVGPSARSGHAMAFDSARSRVVLNGGWNVVDLRDTWEWDGIGWSQVAALGPAGRDLHAMAYDPQRGVTVIFGGQDHGTSGCYSDTWEWDGVNWTHVTNLGPYPRCGHAMTFDSGLGRVILHGGTDGSNDYSDTWTFDGISWVNGGSIGPPARTGHAIAYDVAAGRTVLFGGRTTSGTPFGDTWEYRSGVWRQLPVSAPPARSGHTMAYDSLRGTAVMFGGQSNGYLGDTWEHEAMSAVASSFGAGCGSPALILAPDPSASPLIGALARATLTQLPSTTAFMSLGWSRTSVGPFPLPYSLAPYGMPGCSMLQSTDAAAQPVAVNGGAGTYTLTIPYWVGLIGLPIYLQGWAGAPGANPGGLIVSNGVEWVIGNQ